MGRKAKAASPQQEQGGNTSSSTARSSIEKMFGEGVIINGTQVIDNPPEIISVSPKLDSGLGGGFQVGSIVILGGPPRCGKTTTAVHFAGRWQAMGRRVVYVNAEGRLHERDLTGIPGLKPEEFEIVRSYKGKILTTQEQLWAVEQYLMQETNILVIVDSFSIMCEEKEMIGDYSTETRGGSGKIIGKFCRRMAPVIPTNDNMVIGIVHQYSNTSGYGKYYQEAISSKLNYGLATKMHASKFELWYENEKAKEGLIGQRVYWQVERSPLGPPVKEVISYIKYGGGIDEIQEAIEMAEQLRIIVQAGSWYTLTFIEGSPRVQGEAKIYQRLQENPEELQMLITALKEIIS